MQLLMGNSKKTILWPCNFMLLISFYVFYKKKGNIQSESDFPQTHLDLIVWR